MNEKAYRIYNILDWNWYAADVINYQYMDWNIFDYYSIDYRIQFI